MKFAFAGAHIYFEFDGRRVVHLQAPGVVRVSDDLPALFLIDGQRADAIFHGVVHFRHSPGSAAVEFRFQQLLRTAFEAQLTRRHFQVHVNSFGALQADGLGVVAAAAGGNDVPIRPVEPVGGVVMPEQNGENDQEQQRTNHGANGKRRGGLRIAVALHAIPEHSRTHENQEERPILPENGEGIKIGQPTPQQK